MSIFVARMYLSEVTVPAFHLGPILDSVSAASACPPPHAPGRPGSVCWLPRPLSVKGSEAPYRLLVALACLLLHGLSVPTSPRGSLARWVRAARARVFGEMRPFGAGCPGMETPILPAHTLVLPSCVVTRFKE